MKLWLTSEDVDWDTGRYHYAAEQMMLTLFPLEKPEYPNCDPPDPLTQENNAVVFTLRRGKKLASLTALLLRDGRRSSGAARFGAALLDAPPEQVYHTVQHALKLALYRAGAAHLGHGLPWGALSGVRPSKLPTKALLGGATPAQAKRELEQTYCVSPLRAQLAVDCAQESVKTDAMLAPGDLSLYLGIPFCPTRCAYCSFISADVQGALALVEPYVQALSREISWAGDLLRQKGLRLRSIYMGGGTPTALTAQQLDLLLTQLDRWLDRDPLVEFTVEAGRPDTITPDKLEVLRRHGVDRISVNPQTLSDSVLRTMGRAHTVQQFLDAYALARSYGFSALNTDLIAGLPTDTPEQFSATLDGILALAPEELTLHTLALKNGSALLRSPQDLPDAAAVTQMLSAAHAAFTAAGYRPYYLYRQKYMTGALENVGWTRRERGSFYNIVMMEELHSVLALGAGGVTKLVDRPAGRILRLNNPKYPKEYLERLPDTMRERESLPWPK